MDVIPALKFICENPECNLEEVFKEHKVDVNKLFEKTCIGYCHACGNEKVNLTKHHIIMQKKLKEMGLTLNEHHAFLEYKRTELSNLLGFKVTSFHKYNIVLLCLKCHREVHRIDKKLGYVNQNTIYIKLKDNIKKKVDFRGVKFLRDIILERLKNQSLIDVKSLLDSEITFKHVLDLCVCSPFLDNSTKYFLLLKHYERKQFYVKIQYNKLALYLPELQRIYAQDKIFDICGNCGGRGKVLRFNENNDLVDVNCGKCGKLGYIEQLN